MSLQVWATWLLYAMLVDLTDRIITKLWLDRLPIFPWRWSTVRFRSMCAQPTAAKPTTAVLILVADYSLFGLVKRKRPYKFLKKEAPITLDG